MLDHLATRIISSCCKMSDVMSKGITRKPLLFLIPSPLHIPQPSHSFTLHTHTFTFSSLHLSTSHTLTFSPFHLHIPHPHLIPSPLHLSTPSPSHPQRGGGTRNKATFSLALSQVSPLHKLTASSKRWVGEWKREWKREYNN